MTPAWSRKTWAGSLSRGWLGMLGPGAAARTLAVVEAQIPQESLHWGRHPLGRPGPGQGRDGKAERHSAGAPPERLVLGFRRRCGRQLDHARIERTAGLAPQPSHDARWARTRTSRWTRRTCLPAPALNRVFGVLGWYAGGRRTTRGKAGEKYAGLRQARTDLCRKRVRPFLGIGPSPPPAAAAWRRQPRSAAGP